MAKPSTPATTAITARVAAANRLAHFGSRVKIVEANFADFTPPEKAILVIADLGVSSPQLDQSKRGFTKRYCTNIAVIPKGNTHIAMKRAPKNLIELFPLSAFWVDVYIVSALLTEKFDC